MQTYGPKRPAILVSFSGIDGSGKSTQINALCQRLQNSGKKVTLIPFWDDVSRLKILRESTGHWLFKGDKGVGAPDAPITRRDKNIQSWPMTCIRLVLYFIDAVSARSSVLRESRSDADVIIYDRYCYDELANLNLQNTLMRKYVNLLLRIVPKLDRSYLLDADPFQARTRKPEYPLEFVQQNRAAYLQLHKLAGRMTVILPMSAEDVERAIWRHLSEDLSFSSDEGSDHPNPVEQEQQAINRPDGLYTRPAA